jgi:DNA-binding SARP family transcriptional activator/tetratricopeptide (TPR) repeat protein
MRFEILGPVRIWAQNRELPVTAGHEQTVLAMLILDPDNTVPIERLVDALWSDNAPRSARGQLHSCVSRLRKHLTEGGLPGQVIVTDPAGYRLRTGVVAVDLLEFRATVADARVAATAGRRTEARARYRAALGLWRGPAFAGIDRPAIRRAAAGLEEERARAVEECIEVELRLGGGGELVGELTELVHQHPYRESLHAALMLALYRADRQADALAAYQRVRRALVSELGQEPARALRELHQRILSGDESLRSVTRPTSDGGPPSPGAGHGLPRTLDDFTGRDADLAWLLEIAGQPDAYAPRVLAIDGMPGVGKTSLAVRAAHLLKPRFPDGQLFIDLNGHSEHRPVEPAAALDTLLRQLGVPAAQIPAELDERVARWRAELATRRALVVLDNAATSSQATPLLPASPGCLALITSRRRLVDLEGAHPRSVDLLDPTDAVALLERIAGHRVADEPEAAAEVAKRCGYLPLALRLAGARLAHRPHWRVQDLADRLSDPDTPLSELTAGDRTVADAFALSYGQLPPASQRMFRLLGLHPGEHFDAYAAAALANIHLHDAQQLLDNLVDAHLVQEFPANRYRLHDLLKSYATELTGTADPEQDRAHAIEQLLDYYLHAVADASLHLETRNSRRNFQPGEPMRPDLARERNAQGTEWLDEERSSLVAAVHYAAALGCHRYTWQLARAMWRFLFLRGHLDELVGTHRLGLAATEHLNDADAAAAMHNYLASAYFLNGYYDEAAEHVRHTLTRRLRTGDRIGETTARRNLATVYAYGGLHREATDECERALAVAAKSDDLNAITYTALNASAISLMLGRYHAALTHGRRALILGRELGDEHCLGTALGNVGIARARLGQTGPAFRLLRAALRVRRQAHDRWGEAEALNVLGAVCRAFRRFEDAIVHHQQALAIVQEAGFRQEECAVYNEFGLTLREAGDLGGALELHQRALDGATKIRHKYSTARALDGIAACVRLQDPESARRHWLKALQLYEELDVPERHELARQLAALHPVPVD